MLEGLVPGNVHVARVPLVSECRNGVHAPVHERCRTWRRETTPASGTLRASPNSHEEGHVPKLFPRELLQSAGPCSPPSPEAVRSARGQPGQKKGMKHRQVKISLRHTIPEVDTFRETSVIWPKRNPQESMSQHRSQRLGRAPCSPRLLGRKRWATRISCYGAPPPSACAAFIKESRMECANADKFYRKSGEPNEHFRSIIIIDKTSTSARH